ncbi:MAG: SRPBCC family protein [Burkholderiales bacterium]|jgi:carbon monoxide dehydrogenase subunit G
MIEISERIDVPAPPRPVWDLLSQPTAVVECVPGATLGEAHEDGTFDGNLVVKFGPAKVTFRARIALELDEAAMKGKVTARGKDNQGGARFTAATSFTVMEHPEKPGSTILINGETEIAGKLAGLVESGAKIVIKRMTAEFAERLAARCATANLKTGTDDDD